MPAAATPIPADKRIDATVVRTIAPATRPMHMPTDVAVDSKGRVYIVDGVNDRILRFAGDSVDSLPADAALKLRQPTGLFIDKQDRLWIADTLNQRVVRLDADGKSEAIDLPKPEGNHKADPTDLVLSPDGKRLYIADNDNHRVLVRDMSKGTWQVMGAPGKAQGQFQYPFMLAIGKEDYVYISEAIGARVQVLSPQDRWAGEIGRWGVELGQLYRPKGVAVDVAGRVFVSDSTLGVIQVFGERGAVIGVLCGKDGSPLRLAHPMGMSFDKDGRLYVVELKENRVAVIEMTKPRNSNAESNSKDK